MDKTNSLKAKNIRIAVVDTGSNTIRLAIYEVEKDKKTSFKELLDKKNVAGLSAYVKDGIFSDAGTEKASTVLKDHIKRANNLKCEHIFVFGTAVLRNCKNSASVKREIEQEIDCKIEILSSQEEAQLGIKGALHKTDIDSGIMIDLGGGSCEVTNFDRGVYDGTSLPFGCVSTYAKYISEILPTEKEYKLLSNDISKIVFNSEIAVERDNKNLYGIGGSVRAIAKMLASLQGIARPSKTFNRSELELLEKLLFDDTSKFAHTLVSSNADRLHSFVPGMVIIKTIMEYLQKDTLSICKWGLREGYLLSKLEKI